MGQKGPFCSHNEGSLNHLDIEGHKKVYFVFYVSQLIPDDAWLYQFCSRIPDPRLTIHAEVGDSTIMHTLAALSGLRGLKTNNT